MGIQCLWKHSIKPKAAVHLWEGFALGILQTLTIKSLFRRWGWEVGRHASPWNTETFLGNLVPEVKGKNLRHLESHTLQLTFNICPAWARTAESSSSRLDLQENMNGGCFTALQVFIVASVSSWPSVTDTDISSKEYGYGHKTFPVPLWHLNWMWHKLWAKCCKL